MTSWPPLHDYSRSRAVVMGTWRYKDLESVDAVRQLRSHDQPANQSAGYASARRAYIESDRRAEISSSRTDSAEAGIGALRAELSAAEKTLEREIESRRALAEKLKLTAGYGGRG